MTISEFMTALATVAAEARAKIPAAEIPLFDALVRSRLDVSVYGTARFVPTPEVEAAYWAQQERLTREQARRLRARTLNYAAERRRGGRPDVARAYLRQLRRLPVPRRLP
jgi:hypothetical protein